MKPLRVLHVEDEPTDSKLLDRELGRLGYDVTSRRVQTAEALRAALDDGAWDIVLSDYSMPSFDAVGALRVLKDSGRDVPFIVVSGSIGEETAIEILKKGAADFIIKTNLARLGPAVERELEDARTRRERAEAFLALQEAVKARDDFLSIASHELKTPLAALRLQLQTVLRRLDAIGVAPNLVEVRDKVAGADRSAARLSALVEKLLEITRLTSGKMDLRLERVNLGDVVRAAVDGLQQIASRAGSTITVTVDPIVWGTLDRERVRSVVDNLVENAVKYGAGRPVHVTVEDRGDEGRVTVRDEGIGISDEDRQRIFERFERAVPEKHFGGFGLGLWLTRKIVTAHGGTIQVESRSGSGSTFMVDLPKNRSGD
ncbi:MAG TPA: hybrid sensor histidine kinase/response regulator [Polyangia bacterium]|nr:hybrid sensor histidine kinase/response regulator [Polyangia bacterium]